MSHYIDPRQKPFAHLDRLAGWQRGETPAPVTLEWDLSNRCPWGCQDCHFAHTHTKGPWTRLERRLPMLHDRGGDLADPQLVFRVLGEVAVAGVKGIVWTGGGEPSVHPQAAAIWRHAAALGLQQGMYTLGATLNDDQIGLIRSRFAWVVISLDHASAAAYVADKRCPGDGFQRACEAIRRLSGGQATVGVSFLLHERNYGQAERMVALARSLGATYATLRPTIRTSPDAPGVPVGDRAWVREALPLLERLSTEPDIEVDPARFAQWATWTQHPYRICHGIKLNATITPDGRVWVCPNRREYGDGSCIGDLRQQSWRDVWARHPGAWTDFRNCRAMCRLNPVNETLAAVYAFRHHAEFI